MRTSGVKLVADVTQFKREMTEAEKATLGLKDGLEDVATEGDRAGDKLGKKFGESGKAAHVLRGEIDQTRGTLANLAHEFANTDDAAKRLDITKSIRKQQGELRQLLSVEKLLPKPAAVEAVGSKIGKTLGTSIGDHLELLKSGPALAAIAAVAAPVIGATISAAVIGAAGVGGVIGGVVLAAKDPRVKGAGTQLGRTLLGDLQQDADPFIQPVLKAIATIEGRFGAMNTRIKSIFSTSSGFLGPLVDGTLDAVDGVLRGVDALVSKGAPVIDALGDSFGILGNSVGDALSTISGDSEDAASALTNLAKATGGAIEATGYLVRGLTELYGWVSFVPGKIHGVSEALGGFVGIGDQANKTISGTVAATAQQVIQNTLLGSSYGGTAEGIAYTNELLAANQKRLDEAAAAAQSLRKANQDLYGTETAVAQAFADANKAISEHGKGLDVNTQKGRDNRTTIAGVADSINAEYKNLIAVNGVTPTTSKQAGDLRNKFIGLAEKAGASASQAKNLANRLLEIPAKKDVKINADPSDAIAASREAKAAINSVNSKSVSITVTTVLRTNRVGDEALHGLPRKAAGGSVSARRAYLVGEKRAEVFVPDQNGTIVPSVSQYAAGNATREYAMSSGRGGGATYMSLVVQNHGVIGSKAEVDNWLSGAVDDLKRRGKI